MELGGSLPHSQESTTCPFPSQINPFLCPSHFSQAQLVSFLVGLRTYLHPGKDASRNHPILFIKVTERLKLILSIETTVQCTGLLLYESVVWRRELCFCGRCVFVTVGDWSMWQIVETSGCFETVASEDFSFQQGGLFQTSPTLSTQCLPRIFFLGVGVGGYYCKQTMWSPRWQAAGHFHH